jgi:protein-tyrosine-phosphatase
MAQAFFNYFSKNWKAISAGLVPDEKIHPWTVEVMREIGIDVSRQEPKLLTTKILEKADKIVVVDSDAYKGIPRKYSSKVETWEIDKLMGKPIEKIKEIRDEIEKRIIQLIKELDA